MKALVKTQSGYGNIEICEMPEPQCGVAEVKIEIKATGICGTDLHIYHDRFACTPPVILGHEFCGEVTEVGENVINIKPGDRVVAENVCISCGKCTLCLSGHYAICNDRKAQGVNLNGGFTKYVVCREDHVYKIPDNISFAEGALSEPLVCCTHAVLDQTVIHAGGIVLVSGPGAIGLMCAQLAKAEGATVVLTGTNSDKERLKVAKELGIDKTINIQEEDIFEVVNKLTDNRGVDVVLECSGVESAVHTGFKLIKKRGAYVQVGLFGKSITLDFEQVCYKEIKLTGTLSHTRKAWIKGLELVKQGKVKLKPLITDVVSLNDWKTGFEKFERKEGIKIVLTID